MERIKSKEKIPKHGVRHNENPKISYKARGIYLFIQNALDMEINISDAHLLFFSSEKEIDSIWENGLNELIDKGYVQYFPNKTLNPYFFKILKPLESWIIVE